MKKILMFLWLAGSIILIAGGLIYGAWLLEREINYNLSYKSMVQETVREMVKKEALKDTTSIKP